MKSTEMIFLDNESLWEQIEKYAAARAETEKEIERYRDCSSSIIWQAQQREKEEKQKLQLMLGLPNETEENKQ